MAGRAALFGRRGRGVALTPEGDALLAEIGPALDRIAAAAASTGSGRAAPWPTVLRVNALATFGLRWLLPRLPLFQKEHPGIEVRADDGERAGRCVAGLLRRRDPRRPDSYHGFVSLPLLAERRLPVCSPALAARLGLETVPDLERHTLLHVTSMPRLWRDWLTETGHAGLTPRHTLTFDHFYLSIQAAIDGLGVAMGPTALIGDDLAAGRLITPFPETGLPARTYYAYLPERPSPDEAADLFCAWLARRPQALRRRWHRPSGGHDGAGEVGGCACGRAQPASGIATGWAASLPTTVVHSRTRQRVTRPFRT